MYNKDGPFKESSPCKVSDVEQGETLATGQTSYNSNVYGERTPIKMPNFEDSVRKGQESAVATVICTGIVVMVMLLVIFIVASSSGPSDYHERHGGGGGFVYHHSHGHIHHGHYSGHGSGHAHGGHHG